MLQLSYETLGWIILRARAVEIQDVDTSDQAGDDGGNPLAVLEARSDDPAKLELASWIADLTDTEQAQLVALFWMGRDDGSAGEFEDYVEQARHSKEMPTERYLMRQSLLAEMLEEGLNRMGIDFSEIEAEL